MAQDIEGLLKTIRAHIDRKPEMQDLPLREGKNTFDYFGKEG